MTYYVIKLTADPCLYYGGLDPIGIRRVAELRSAWTFNDRPVHLHTALAYQCWPIAEIVEVQPEPVTSITAQRNMARDELKRAYDAIPPGIADRNDSVSAAVAKFASAYEAIRATAEDTTAITENYSAALRALPEEFRGYDALPDSVSKLARAYEAIQAENATLSAELSEAKLRLPADLEGYGLTMGIIELCRRLDVANAEPVNVERDDAVARVRQLGTRVTELADRVATLEAENAKLKANLAKMTESCNASLRNATTLQERLSAKPEPVADERIRDALDEMNDHLGRRAAPDRDRVIFWHDTLQAVGADLVVARESLAQMTALKEEMRKERDDAREKLEKARWRASMYQNKVTILALILRRACSDGIAVEEEPIE